MKLNFITATIAALGLSVSSAYANTSLDDYIQESINGSYRIKSLEAAHQVEVLRAEQEEKHYLPSFKIDHTTKTNAMDNPIGIKPWESRAHESNVNLRSNIWRDNHDELYSIFSTKADAAAMNVNIQKSNIRAQITTAVYSIFLYENLIKEGEEILVKAKQIDADI